MSRIPMRSQRRRLVDETMDAYAGWRDQCSAVELAYSHWTEAQGDEAAVRYIAYSAALDREERAAARYGRLMRRVGALAAADLEPMKRLPAAAGSW
jgi:hypothetical protein